MSGKYILLAGASGGIGHKLTPMFPEDTMILHYNKHEPAHGGYCKKRADITDYNAVERMVSDILKEFGKIDVLINACGISISSFAHKFQPDIWRSVVDINLMGAFNLIRAVLPSMRENNYGRIILISSIVFQSPQMGTSAYAASKAALVGLTRTIALENANKGITCNCISLGYFEAGMIDQVPNELREELIQDIPLKRLGRVDEIHKTIRFLIDTEYVTGQTLSLNGGLYMS